MNTTSKTGIRIVRETGTNTDDEHDEARQILISLARLNNEYPTIDNVLSLLKQ